MSWLRTWWLTGFCLLTRESLQTASHGSVCGAPVTVCLIVTHDWTMPMTLPLQPLSWLDRGVNQFIILNWPAQLTVVPSRKKALHWQQKPFDQCGSDQGSYSSKLQMLSFCFLFSRQIWHSSGSNQFLLISSRSSELGHLLIRQKRALIALSLSVRGTKLECLILHDTASLGSFGRTCDDGNAHPQTMQAACVQSPVKGRSRTNRKTPSEQKVRKARPSKNLHLLIYCPSSTFIVQVSVFVLPLIIFRNFAGILIHLVQLGNYENGLLRSFSLVWDLLPFSLAWCSQSLSSHHHHLFFIWTNLASHND